MTAMLGPVPCRDCGTLVWYGRHRDEDVWPRWRTKGGQLHACEPDPEDGELGPVRVCARCGEQWPRDEEFYARTSRLTLRRTCKACQAEATA